MVKFKFLISLIIATAWATFAYWLSIGWVDNMEPIFGKPMAWIIASGIAIIPGFSTAFIYPLLLLDKRPHYTNPVELPDVSVLIAAFNEETNIEQTLKSITYQQYPQGNIEVIIIDDGSTDNTVKIVNEFISTFKSNQFKFKLIPLDKNQGKAHALNVGLNSTINDYVVTIDADTFLQTNALATIVTNIHHGPENTAAVAGTVLVQNSNTNLLTRLQHWEYLLTIAASKRAQSMLNGTLVAQGGFSIYNTKITKQLGGWDTKSVGEDIVLTWGMQEHNYRVGHSEHAIAFTTVPETYKIFFKQRERWARGLIEAFKRYPKILRRFKLTMPFIIINLFLPVMDTVFLFAFIPGLIAAIIFKWYVIASIMTLLILPMTFILNMIMYRQEKHILSKVGVDMKEYIPSLILYMIGYLFIMCPATVYGYWREILKLGKKSWGTK